MGKSDPAIEAMRRDQREASGCLGKTRHPTKDAAIYAANLKRFKSAKTHPYLCEFCHGWHIGTSR